MKVVKLTFAKVLFIIIIITLTSFASIASAHHSLGTYHWPRSSNPFSISLGDNVNKNWDSYLNTASADWSLSSVLDTQIVSRPGNQKSCRPILGEVKICNSKYGNTNWLGTAQVYVAGLENHITQAVVKLNDTYFSTPAYDTVAWRNLTMCHEVGHTLGLDHQDEDFFNQNLGTCLDYTADPTTNQHPNYHDYDELYTIYSHLDLIGMVLPGVITQDTNLDSKLGENIDASSWGTAIAKDKSGKDSVFEKDLGNGNKAITYVSWVE